MWLVHAVWRVLQLAQRCWPRSLQRLRLSAKASRWMRRWLPPPPDSLRMQRPGLQTGWLLPGGSCSRDPQHHATSLYHGQHHIKILWRRIKECSFSFGLLMLSGVWCCLAPWQYPVLCRAVLKDPFHVCLFPGFCSPSAFGQAVSSSLFRALALDLWSAQGQLSTMTREESCAMIWAHCSSLPSANTTPGTCC